MSVAAGPNVVASGLALEYDMSNTRRSWMGMPTTNLAAFDVAVNGFNTDTPANLTQTSNSSEATYQGRLSRKMVVGAGYWNSYIYSYNTGVSSTVFAVSFKVKVNDGSHPNAFMSGGYIYGSAGNTYPALTFQLIDDGWYLASCTYSGASMTLNSLTGMNGSSPGAKTFYIVDYQAEAQTFASPFVIGTRTNTQALIDLAGNYTLTADGLTYNSDNTFTFNNGIVSSSLPAQTVANSTLEAILYDTKASGYRSIIQINNNSDDALYIFPVSNFLGFWPDNSSTLPVPANQWVYVAASYNGSSITYCVNDSIQVVPGVAADFTDYQFFRVGGISAADSERFGGKIAVTRMYNRALSSAEIAQNFNALRSRYGI